MQTINVPSTGPGTLLVSAGDGPTLIINSDLNNFLYLGDDVSVNASDQNEAVPLSPNGSLPVDGSRDVYGQTGGPNFTNLANASCQVYIVPGGGSPFLGLTTGQGSLSIPEIRSPNFVHGVSGWAIFKNGSAEFNTITVPPGTSGNTVFVQATQPVANAVGDLWFNSSGGFQISQWDGTNWIPFQYGAQALGQGSVVAGTIAADALDSFVLNSVTINGQTITAANVIISGTAGGLFAYGTGGTITVTLTSGTWKAPAGVTTAKVECWAAGAGGSGGFGGLPLAGGGGGGGGEYAAESNLAVTPGNTYAPTFGAAGTAGASGGGPGGNGGNTTFPGDAVTVTAHGGTGANGRPPGAGGTGSVNSVHFDGGSGGFGSGAAGVGNNNGGGGGGGSGGTASNGNSGQNGVEGTFGAGAAAVSGGGPGGNGGKPFGSGSLPLGQAPPVGPGGGGGGGSVSSGTGRSAGPGFAGQVRITYTSAAPALVASIAGLATTDPVLSSAVPEGAMFDNARITKALALPNVAAPAAVSGSGLLYGAGGMAGIVSGGGVVGEAPINGLATFPNITVTQAALTNLSTVVTIPANDAVPGAIYELEIWGNGTQGTIGNRQTLEFSISLGGTALQNITYGTTAIPDTNSPFRFTVTARVICVTTGATGTWRSSINSVLSQFLNAGANLSSSNVNTQPGFVCEAAGTTVKDTTVNESLVIQAAWGAVTGSPTLTSQVQRFNRIA